MTTFGRRLRAVLVAALVLGSVSHELVHQSRVPVTVVSAEVAEASAFPA